MWEKIWRGSFLLKHTAILFGCTCTTSIGTMESIWIGTSRVKSFGRCSGRFSEASQARGTVPQWGMGVGGEVGQIFIK